MSKEQSKDKSLFDEGKDKSKALLKNKMPNKERRDKILDEFTDIDKITQEVKEWLHDFLTGFGYFVKGLPDILKSGKIQKFHKNTVKIGGITLVVSYILIKSIFIPIYLVLAIVNLFYTLSDSSWGLVEDASNEAIFLVPLIMLGFLRNVYSAPFDKIYFAALKDKNPILAAKIHDLERESTMEMMKKSIMRGSKLLGAGLVFYILCQIPFIHHIAVPLADFFLFKKKLGLKMSLLCFVVSIVFGKVYVQHILGYWMASRGLARELLDNYVSRIKMHAKEQHKFFQKNDAMLLGFFFPVYCMVSIKLIGSLFFGVAFAQAGVITIILEDNNPYYSLLNPSRPKIILSKKEQRDAKDNKKTE